MTTTTPLGQAEATTDEYASYEFIVKVMSDEIAKGVSNAVNKALHPQTLGETVAANGGGPEAGLSEADAAEVIKAFRRYATGLELGLKWKNVTGRPERSLIDFKPAPQPDNPEEFSLSASFMGIGVGVAW